MRKLFLLLILSVLSAVTARAETQTYPLGLQTDDTGWNDANGGWYWDTWDKAWAAYDPDIVGYRENSFSIPANSEATLTFEQTSNVSLSEIYAGGSNFVVRVVGSDEWTPITPVYDEGDNDLFTFTTATVNLNAYSGKTIQIGFKTSESYTDLWEVKNVNITVTTTGGGEEPDGPGEINFSYLDGSTLDAGAELTITSEGATKITYVVNGVSTEVDGDTATFTLPDTDGTCTVSVTATNGTKEVTGTATYTLVAPKPGQIVFDPATGTQLQPGQTVTITSDDATKILYSINTDPAVEVEGDRATVTMPDTDGSYILTVTAYRGSQSLSHSANYTVVTLRPGDVTFSVANGSTVDGGTKITIASENADRIEYTLNGETINVTGSSAIATLPDVNGQYTISATAYRGSETATASATYTVVIPVAGPVAFDPASGTVEPGTVVTISSANATEMFYTLAGTSDGEEPARMKITGATGTVTLPEKADTYTLTAWAYRGTSSEYTEGVATYVIPAEQPGDITFDPATGTQLNPGDKVTVSSADATKIAYTLNGTTTEVEGATATVTLPTDAGEYTLDVTAYRGLETRTASATYTVTDLELGDITFTPAENSSVGVGTVIHIKAVNAKQIYCAINDGEQTPFDGDMAQITVPDEEGEFTVKVTATRGSQSKEANATYTAIVLKPDVIHFDPADGSQVASASKVTVTSTDADKIVYYITDTAGETVVEETSENLSSVIVTLPDTPGTFYIHATAYRGDETVTASAHYLINQVTVNPVVFNPASGAEVEAGSTVTISSERASSIHYEVYLNDELITKTDVPVSGSSVDVTLPTEAGTCTVKVIAFRGMEDLDAEANYTILPPKPGEVVFTPPTGSQVDGGSTINVTSANATKISYTVGDAEPVEVDGNKANITLPETSGECTVKVTAYRDEATLDAEATYTLTAPKPGAIIFFPTNETALKYGTTVTILSDKADAITYTINDGEETTVNASTATVTMPDTAGEYTINVTARRGEETVTASTTYTVYVPNQPGAIVFDPLGGLVQPGRQITVSSEDAEEVKIQINGGPTYATHGSELIMSLPTEPGTYTVHATAVRGSETTEASTEYIIQSDVTVTGGDFLLLSDIANLQSEDKILIADPNHNPQTIMCNPGGGQTLFPQDEATITNGVVVHQGTGLALPVEAADGGWYIGDTNGYLYCDADGTLSKSTTDKTLFSIAIDKDGVATIKTLSEPAGLTLCHSSIDAGYACYSNINASGLSLPSIYYQYTLPPGDVVFSPLSGILSEYDDHVITITAEGASSITYNYFTLTGTLIEQKTVIGSTATLEITQSGDVSATANNPNGFSLNSATYYVSTDPTIVFQDLDSDDPFSYFYWRHYSFRVNEDYDPTNPSSQEEVQVVNIWAWTQYPENSDNYFLTASLTDGSIAQGHEISSYTYTRSQMVLPADNVKSIIAEFDIESSNLDALEEQGCLFMIREFKDEYAGTDEEVMATCRDGWTFINMFDNIVTKSSADALDKRNAPATAKTVDAKVDLSEYKGKNVQIGYYYATTPTSAEPLRVQNLVVRQNISTGIEDITAGDANEAPVEYYNLRGIRVSDTNLAPGLYIRRQGNVATKVLIK